MNDGTMSGTVRVWVENEGDASERRIYLLVSGLPGWVLGMLRDAAPLRGSGSSYECDRADKSGPSAVQFRADRAFVAAAVPCASNPPEAP